MSAICEWCPFVRGCDVCTFQGGEMPETQANPGAGQRRETSDFDTMGPASETAPTEARQRFNRGLTADSTPD